mgnify:CR=1 FL=1
MITYSIIFLLLGLVFLIIGGDLLVRGSVSFANIFRVPSFLIGVTVVSFGTSAPELMVSIQAALDNPVVSPAEKLRQVLDGYAVESEYGRKIDTYKDTILIDEQERDVNILRIGRLVLAYQTSDLSETDKEIDDLFKDLNSDAIKFQELYYLERQHINFLDKQRCGNFIAS